MKILTDKEQAINDHIMDDIGQRTDMTFVKLLSFEWVMAVIFSVITTPITWSGNSPFIHPHVYVAVFLGGVITLYPIYLVKYQTTNRLNRYVMTTSQMIFSVLLIHLCDGRIETHFHIFGSLAILAFYHDVKVIYLGTLITVIDHVVRGAMYPESIYGVDSATIWRALEHASWVLFEDIFIVIGIKSALKAIAEFAVKESFQQESFSQIEKMVEERTFQLLESQRLVIEQQQSLMSSAKLSSLGEMAAGIAHEINNPLAIISNTSKFMRKRLEHGKLDSVQTIDCLDDIDVTVERASKIIKGLRNISRDSSEEKFEDVSLKDLFSDVLSICSEKFKNNSVELLIVDYHLMELSINCRRVQLSQVLLNLVSNSFDAVQSSHQKKKWVRISIEKMDSTTIIKVADSGDGIPQDVRAKMFQPFFTTKDIGKGTGLGLSLSKSIMENHGGDLSLDEGLDYTQFSLVLPLHKKAS